MLRILAGIIMVLMAVSVTAQPERAVKEQQKAPLETAPITTQQITTEQLLFVDGDRLLTAAQLEQERQQASQHSERWQTNFKIVLLGPYPTCPAAPPAANSCGFAASVGACAFFHAPNTNWTSVQHFSQCDYWYPLANPVTAANGITYTGGLLHSCSIECQ